MWAGSQNHAHQTPNATPYTEKEEMQPRSLGGGVIFINSEPLLFCTIPEMYLINRVGKSIFLSVSLFPTIIDEVEPKFCVRPGMTLAYSTKINFCEVWTKRPKSIVFFSTPNLVSQTVTYC